MNSGNSGDITNLTNDNCFRQQDMKDNNGIYGWKMYTGKYENKGRCLYNNEYPRPFDASFVDTSSYLRLGGIGGTSLCSDQKYTPTCVKSKQCMNTFDKSAPVVLAPEVCPIVRPDLKKPSGNGVNLPPFTCN